MAQGWGFQSVRAYPSTSASAKSTNNPKNAPSGPAARRKEIRAVIKATGAPKTITRVWNVVADRCVFAGDGWGEGSYDVLARDAHASERTARYAVKYGAAIGLFTVDVRPTAGRGGWNLPNRYRFELVSYDPSAVESFKEWRARVGKFAYPDRGRQIAPGSVRTSFDMDEVHYASRTSLSGPEHPQAATAGKNANGRSGCSGPDGPASFGTGSGRDSEQEARAEYRAPASGPAGSAGRSTMKAICASADQRGEQGGNGMRLMDANEGDVLERGSERVVIRSVERDRNFVTYCRRVDGDPNRVYTATATHDDASEPAHRTARDWLRA